MKLWRLFMHYCTALCFIGLSVLLPTAQAIAAAGQFNVQWANVQATNTAYISIPKDNWTEIARTNTRNGSQFDLSLLKGERWITMNQGNVGQLGMSSDQVSTIMQRFASGGSVVYARYDPNQAQLRINALRVNKTHDGFVRVYLSDFTPHHGERLRKSRYYMSASEKFWPNALGNNPFQQFRADNTDPVFYNISWEGAQVAVGLAMAYTNATIAFVSVPQTHIETETHTSGGLFSKTTTTTYKGYAKPLWFVGLPWDMQPRGRSAQICAIQYGGGSSCDDPGHIVSSGISIDSWNGGNMPANEDLLYQSSTSQSSWTVLAFALVTFALAWGAGFALTGGAGWSVGAATSTGAVSATEASALAGAAYGSIGAGTYAVSSSVLNGGGLTDVQQSYLGQTGWGQMSPAPASNDIQQGLNSAVNQRHINNGLSGSLTGTQVQYMGNCSEGWTRAECVNGGLDTGTMPRPESHAEMNETKYLKARNASCAASGLTGVALRECAAPTVNPTGGWILQP